MKYFLFVEALLGTEPAIQTVDTLKALGLLGLAAIVPPIFIGGLLFFLKETKK